MPGDAKITDNLLIAGFEQSLHCAALGKDLIDVGHGADIVQLPEIDVIGLQQLQRSFQHPLRAIASALFRLGSEKGFGSAALHDLAYVLLAPALGTAVNG